MEDRILELKRAAIEGDRGAAISLYENFKRVTPERPQGFYQIWDNDLKDVFSITTGVHSIKGFKARGSVLIEDPTGKRRRLNSGEHFYFTKIFVSALKEGPTLGLRFAAGGRPSDTYTITYEFDPKEGDYVLLSRRYDGRYMRLAYELEEIWDLDAPERNLLSTQDRNCVIARLVLLYEAAEKWLATNADPIIQAAIAHGHWWVEHKFKEAQRIIWEHEALMDEFHRSSIALWDYPHPAPATFGAD